MSENLEEQLEEVRKKFSLRKLMTPENFDTNMIKDDINQVHLLGRKAKKCSDAHKFEEAQRYHEEAAAKLETFLATLDPDVNPEPLKLQRDFHQRQAMLAVVHRDSWEARQQAGLQAAHAGLQEVPQREELESLKSLSFYTPLLHTMERMSTLLGQLDLAPGSKLPKSPQDFIEELQITNKNLRRIIFDLLYDLDKLNVENTRLKAVADHMERPQESELTKNIPAFAPLEMPEFTPRTAQQARQTS